MKIQDIIETPKNPNEFDNELVMSYQQQHNIDPNQLKIVAQKIFQQKGGGGDRMYKTVNSVLGLAVDHIKQSQQQQQQKQQKQQTQQPSPQPAPATVTSKPTAAHRSSVTGTSQPTQQAIKAKSALGRAWQRGVNMADKYVGVARKSR